MLLVIQIKWWNTNLTGGVTFVDFVCVYRQQPSRSPSDPVESYSRIKGSKVADLGAPGKSDQRTTMAPLVVGCGDAQLSEVFFQSLKF